MKKRRQKPRRVAEHLHAIDHDGWYIRIVFGFRLDGAVEWKAVDDFNGCCLANGVIARQHWNQTPDEEKRVMAGALLKRLAKEKAKRPAGGAAVDGESRRQYPAICELLSDKTDVDGQERELSSITIKYQEGSWKGAIHEPNMEMSLWASAATLADVLRVLEERINAEDADWRAWTTKQNKTAKKR